MKKTFQTEAKRAQWLADTVANPLFNEAVSFALSEYASQVCGEENGSQKILGAKEAFEVLRVLPNKETPKTENRRELNYHTRTDDNASRQGGNSR